MRRPSTLIFWLLAVAIFARGMLPWVHGSSMAQDSGNNLLLVFCGSTTPALMNKAKSLTPWAKESPQPAPSQSPLSNCPLCLVGIFALALVALAVLHLFQRQPLAYARALANTVRLNSPPRRYDSRGPPHFAALMN